jgi:uncharacterized protein YkwD
MRSLLRGHQANPIRRATSLAGTTLIVAALLAWTPGIAAGWNQSAAEATLWQLMNGDRVNNGLRPVLSNGTLVSLARWRSKDMIVRNYFSHIILGTNYQVFHWYDLNHLNYAWGGENIGWNSGYADGDSAVAINTAFMNSASHRENILNPVWTHGGVGAYGADNITWQGKLRSPRMYTELFMQARSAPAPTPKPKPPPAPKPTPRPAAPRPAATPRPSAAAPKAQASPTAAPTPDLTPLAAQAVMRAGDAWTIGSGYLLARDPFERELLVAQNVVTGYRIDAPAPADRGFFETVLGTLLSFVL